MGFEARALEPIRSPRAPKRRRRWVFGPLGAAAAGAAATLAIAFAIFGDDVRLANSYQNTLDRANGEKFEATSVYAPHDVEAGTLFGYQGKPSWLFVTVDSSFRAGVRRAELITTDGTRIPLPSFRLDPGTGSWGQALPVGLDRRRQPAPARRGPEPGPLCPHQGIGDDRPAAAAPVACLRPRGHVIDWSVNQPGQPLVSRGAAPPGERATPVPEGGTQLEDLLSGQGGPGRRRSKADRSGDQAPGPLRREEPEPLRHARDRGRDADQGGRRGRGRRDRRRHHGPRERRPRPAQGRRARRRSLRASHRRRARGLRRLRHRLRAGQGARSREPRPGPAGPAVG